MELSWNTPNRNKKKVVAQKANAKKNLSVGDTIIVNYDPFGKHSTRHAVIEQIDDDGYIVRFTSTKGESCDGSVRKSFKRKDGTFVVTTTEVRKITYNQIL